MINMKSRDTKVMRYGIEAPNNFLIPTSLLLLKILSDTNANNPEADKRMMMAAKKNQRAVF